MLSATFSRKASSTETSCSRPAQYFIWSTMEWGPWTNTEQAKMSFLVRTGFGFDSALIDECILKWNLSNSILLNFLFSNLRGTLAHVPPEWLSEFTYNTDPTTVWQLGVVLLDLLHQRWFISASFLKRKIRVSSILSKSKTRVSSRPSHDKRVQPPATRLSSTGAASIQPSVACSEYASSLQINSFLHSKLGTTCTTFLIRSVLLELTVL